MAGQLWLRELKRNKIRRDAVAPCPDGDWQAALHEGCRMLDLAVPMVVPKHLRDWEAFRQMRFTQEHFGEHIAFDRLEVEYFDPDDRDGSHRSDDPRNA